MSRGAHYSLPDFTRADTDKLIGTLTQEVSATGIQSTRSTQIKTWVTEAALLKCCAQALIARCDAAKNWHLILEYELPRRQKRPDAILLADDVILVIEFKVGASTFDAPSRDQVENYCMNLRDFHAGSQGHPIVPVLCATAAPDTHRPLKKASSSTVAHIVLTNGDNLAHALLSAYEHHHNNQRPSIDAAAWIDAPYRPVPSIIEAAERLYEHHGVREISHSYAHNLNATTDMLAKEIRSARERNQHCICFVTGVPGAGKTLTGLNVVHDPSLRAEGGPSGIFLSGNVPLVNVVREALVLSQQRAGRRRKESEHEVSTFIQNVHTFLRYHREHPTAVPHEHVVVFDEAQRAWDQHQMQRKQGVGSSEAAELFEVMNRLERWAVIIALVGGGQEIYLGEAGLEEWGKAVMAQPGWQVVASPEAVSGGASVSGRRLFPDGVPPNIAFRPEPLAHLTVSVRSFRAQQLAEWVDAVLTQDIEHARSRIPDQREFPLVLTRDLNQAKAWLRRKSQPADGERAGLIATSEDQRLRAYGLERSSAFRLGFPFEKWFLCPPTDTRSSHMLEVAASEFECQGLELDWVGLCWGGDLTRAPHREHERPDWEYRKSRGSGWNQIHGEAERTYVRNRYRVLLTRARLGMVIWVPPGNANDHTLAADRFDRVAALLKAAGVPELQVSAENDENV